MTRTFLPTVSFFWLAFFLFSLRLATISIEKVYQAKVDCPGMYTIVVERKRKDEERHEETRDARRQGVSAFQLDSMANRSPTKGNRSLEGVVGPV